MQKSIAKVVQSQRKVLKSGTKVNRSDDKPVRKRIKRQNSKRG
uniref:Uncharacterized protein n=1 Tax=Siphoviridae sp. ctx254 TaxID=2825737 RepID=A0A8S5TVS3_9CAUD|nr:MAG TPA: hypothetical protein [Siphoviridae sp. ctx254]DAZ58346.1 MAG TPA: hypothetical protein [Caudoviricetes sp.]